MKVELEPVAIGEKEVLRQLMELYQYDFSEIDGTDVNALGRFGYRWLDHYWTEPGRHPFFIRANGRLAGFALVRARDDDPAVDREVAEFFVMRRYRRHGVGARAAELLWAFFGGAWSLNVLRRNPGAMAFWEKAVERHTGGRYEVGRWEEEDGIVYRFRAGGEGEG